MVSRTILTVELKFEHDVVLTRQRSRQIASLLGFSPTEQTRIATAVSEIARNAFQYAGGGRVKFIVETERLPAFSISISDSGPGIADLDAILNGHYKSKTGLGAGLVGAKRLMDGFHIESEAGKGTTVLLKKHLGKKSSPLTKEWIAQIVSKLAQHKADNPLEELQQQNQELLHTLEELQSRQAEVERLNRELEETNRGVMALYAELDDKAGILQRASELKSVFLSNMSHEFRTPLNSVLSLSRLLLDRVDGDLTPEQEKQVTFIRQSVQSLSELVNDLLDMAKIESGKISVYPNDFEVANLFGALRGMFRPLVSSESVSLIFEEPVGIPTLYTDEGKVSQILRNFISNALKFTERGEVRVSVKLGYNNTVVFSVADTGIGIATENQERIFEEFIQVDSPIQKRSKGTGLGLPLSRKLAQLLGGDIFVRSESGVGSTFLVSVPLTYSQVAPASDVQEFNWSLDPNRTPILIVEDNRETLLIYEMYFKNSGFQVISARTLKEARAALQMFQPVAVVLDILLGEETTWSLISHIKENERTKNTPVLVVTVIDNRQKAIALGADEFCLKPVDREWLLDKIVKLQKQVPLEKLLIIDDDQVSRYLLKGLLADMPHTIIEAASGGEGIDRARKERPQVIFLDLLMPDKSGFEVLKELKSDPVTKDIPTIVNTSKVLEDEEYSYLAEHAVAIISKESRSREEAIALVRAALGKAKLIAGQLEREDV